MSDAIERLKASMTLESDVKFKIVRLFTDHIVGVQRTLGSDVHAALWTCGRSLIECKCIGCGRDAGTEAFLPLQSTTYKTERCCVPCMQREMALYRRVHRAIKIKE